MPRHLIPILTNSEIHMRIVQISSMLQAPMEKGPPWHLWHRLHEANLNVERTSPH